ncbi:MAG: 4'-phosphopantetheinyl transferase superfamily protein [Mangrovibacterium sp.]
MPLTQTIPLEGGLLLLREMTEDSEQLLSGFPETGSLPPRLISGSKKRKKEWLAIRALLREAGCSPEQLSYSPSGKPHLSHPCYRHISISHSDRLAGLLLQQKLPAGLDIENRSRNFLRVEHKYLSQEEQWLARTIPDGHGLFWCIKEAVYKAAGITGLHFASQIGIRQNKNGKLHAWADAPEEQRLRLFRLLFLETGEQLIVCALEQPEPEVPGRICSQQKRPAL